MSHKKSLLALFFAATSLVFSNMGAEVVSTLSVNCESPLTLNNKRELNKERNSNVVLDSDFVSIQINNFLNDLDFYYYSLGNNMFLVGDLEGLSSLDTNLKAFKIILNNDYYPTDFKIDLSKLYSELLYEKNGLLTKYYVEVNVNRVIEILKRSIDCSSFEVGEPEFTHILSYINYEKNYYEKKQNYQVNSYSLAFEEGTEDEPEPTYKERVNNLINDIDVTDDGVVKFYVNYLQHYKKLPDYALNTIKKLSTNFEPISNVGDDLIVNVIPKELFTFVDERDNKHDPYKSDGLGYCKYKGGNEWGFFMKTIQAGNDFYSDLVLFDVEYNPALIEMDSSFTIKPILSAVYKYNSIEKKVVLQSNSLYYIANPEYSDYYSIYKENNGQLSDVKVDSTNSIPASNIYVDFIGHTRMEKNPASVLEHFLTLFNSNSFSEEIIDKIGSNIFELLINYGLERLGTSSPVIAVFDWGLETIDSLINRYLEEKNIKDSELEADEFVRDGIRLLRQSTNGNLQNGKQFIYNDYIELTNGNLSDTQGEAPKNFSNDYVSYKLEYNNDTPLFLENNGDEFTVKIDRDMHNLQDTNIDSQLIYFYNVDYKLYLYQDSENINRSDVEEIIDCSFVQRSSNLAKGDVVNLKLNENTAILYDSLYSDNAKDYQTFEFMAEKHYSYKFVFKEVIDVEFNLFEKDTNKNVLKYHPDVGISGDLSSSVKKDKKDDQIIFENINLVYNKQYYIRVTQKKYEIISSTGSGGRLVNAPSSGYFLIGYESVPTIYPLDSMYQLDVDLTNSNYELYQFTVNAKDKISFVTNNDIHRDDNDFWDSSNLIQDPCIFVYDKYMNKIATAFAPKSLLGMDLIMVEAGTLYFKVVSRAGANGKCSISAISNYHYLADINSDNANGAFQVDYTRLKRSVYLQYRSVEQVTVGFKTAGSYGIRLNMKIYNASWDILFDVTLDGNSLEQQFTFQNNKFYFIDFQYSGTISQNSKISELIYYNLK